MKTFSVIEIFYRFSRYFQDLVDMWNAVSLYLKASLYIYFQILSQNYIKCLKATNCSTLFYEKHLSLIKKFFNFLLSLPSPPLLVID